MNIKAIIIGIILIAGIAFVASEYGAFQQLSVTTSTDSPDLVYQRHAFSAYGDLSAECKAFHTYPYRWHYFDVELVKENNFIFLKASNITYLYNQTYIEVASLPPAYYCPHTSRVWWHATYYVHDIQTYPPGGLKYEELFNIGGTKIVADHCVFGIEENVYGLKCISYCKPGKSVCAGDVLQTCNADGTEILKTFCEYGCENSACTIPEVFFALNLQTADSYVFGQDASVQASIIVNDKPQANALVNGKIIKDGGVIAETSGYTDENGVVDLVFTNVEGIGDAVIQVTTIHLGETKTTTKDIYFGGEAIIFTPTTYSYIQYTTKDVEFTVEIKDGKGRYITPTIGELTVISTMTNANVISNNVEYIGNGKYRITSDVSGSGLYNGKVNLLYQGVNFESIGISIDVRDVTIDIDTSDITPVATLGDTETIVFYTMSSLGGNIEPDEIKIEVSYPGGYITDTLTMNDLTRVNTGSYEFDYTFNEVEKFTFNIFADKEDYTRGTARASVSVASTVEEAFNPIVFILNNMNLIIGGMILIIGFIVYRRYKK